MKFEVVNCPLCGREQADNLFESSSGNLASCGCGLVYAYQRMTEEEHRKESEWYMPSKFFDMTSDTPFAERRIEANEDLWLIESYAKGNLFDVCFGSGVFAKSAQDRGWNVNGCDLSKMCVVMAKWAWGLRMCYGMLEDCTLSGVVDCFSMCNALEHLRDPVGSMKIMHKNLNDEGVVFIRVPNADTMDLTVDHQLPHHLTNWNEDTMYKLFDKTGFECMFARITDTIVMIGKKIG